MSECGDGGGSGERRALPCGILRSRLRRRSDSFRFDEHHDAGFDFPPHGQHFRDVTGARVFSSHPIFFAFPTCVALLACNRKGCHCMSQRDVHERAIVCVPKLPPPDRMVALAKQAQAIREDNVPEGLDLDALENAPAERGRLALNIRLRWPKSGVRLTVGFLDGPEPELRRKILAHMNIWNRTANVEFVETVADADHADVRVARTPGDGHWSWLGIDIRNHPGEPTMNLDAFTMATPDADFPRVVCHEAGHTLGFPHEHLRGELIDRLDPAKTIAYYRTTQGWTREDVIFQLLTPLKRVDHQGTPIPDPHSIMCYEVPGRCTKDGLPIVGGTEIDATDYAFAARVYPK